MVLFIGFETRGYRLTVYSRSGEPSLLFDQYYPLDIDMDSIFDKQNEIAYKICENIAFLEKKLGSKIKKFYMVCQNNHVVVRNIEVLKDSKRKDIDLVVDIEIMELLNLDKDNYSLVYKKGQVDENDMVSLDICLFPNYFFQLAKYIEKNVKIRCMAIYTNYQLAGHFIENMVEYFALMEIRDTDLVLTILDGTRIKSSIVVDQSYRDENFISYLNSQGKVLVFGDYGSHRFKDLIGSLTNMETLDDYRPNTFGKILEGKDQSLIGGKKSKKDRLVDYYTENMRKSKLNTYLMRFMVLISVLFILMGSRVFMNNRSLNRDLQEARVQSQSRDTRQVDRPKKIDKNIYGLDIVKVYEIHKKLGNMVKKIDYDRDRLLVEFELDYQAKIRAISSDKLFDKASIQSISKVEYYVEKEVERKIEKKPDPSQDDQDQAGQETIPKPDEKFELVKEKVKTKAYKYLVKLEIKN